MQNTLGKNLRLTIFGESHGPFIGAVLDGMMPGVLIDYDFINEQLKKRRPKTDIETQRVELDEYQIISGINNLYTTGDPICVIIPNKDTNSSAYDELKYIPRPSHGDFVYHLFSKGHNITSGGGHTSGRLTTPIVVIGAILQQALQKKGIKIGTHILRIKDIKDQDFKDFDSEIDIISKKEIPVIKDIEEDIKNTIALVKSKKDSIGGILQTAITNLPHCLGNPWFDSFEGAISNAVFSIGGVKGIEFGKGFDFVNYLGSMVNDSFDVIDGKIVTKTNNSGGILAGLTNGMPVVFNTIVKPTPSIQLKQNSVNLLTKEKTTLEIKGRHDPCIARRICVVIDSLCAFVVCDMLKSKYGDYFLDFEV